MRRALAGLRVGCRGGGPVDGRVVAVLVVAVVDFFPVVVVFLPLAFFTPALVAARALPGACDLPGARGPVAAALDLVGAARAVLGASAREAGLVVAWG